MPDQTQLPDQPDGIDEQTHDLPDPARSAERVGEYIKASGDGLYDVQDGNPLYARDLEALTRVPAKLADVQEDLARTIDEADHLRRELDTTRTEADRFAAELASANQQITQTKTHFTRRCDTLTARAERAEAERDQLAAELATLKRHASHLFDGVDAAYNFANKLDADCCGTYAQQLRDAIGKAGTAPVPGSSRRAQEAGDRVEDGGMMGTLVRCEMCGGSGLLHQPDELPETVAPKVDEPTDDEIAEEIDPLSPASAVAVEVIVELARAEAKFPDQTEWALLRPELVQVAAMAIRWILDGDSRTSRSEVAPAASPGCPCGGTVERPVDLDDRATQPALDDCGHSVGPVAGCTGWRCTR